MKKKMIAIILCLSMLVAITACGSTDDTNAGSTEQPSTENEVAIETEAPTEEPTEQITEEPTEEIIEESTEILASDDGIPATNEGLTALEAIQADGEYLDSLGLYSVEQWKEYAASQGADNLECGWLIYYYGHGAGNQRSYAINIRTGERVVAGPNTYLYGSDTDRNNSSKFYGGHETLPGEKSPEYEVNLHISIGIEPEKLYTDPSLVLPYE